MQLCDSVDATPSSRDEQAGSGGGAASTRGLCALLLALCWAISAIALGTEPPARPDVVAVSDPHGLTSLKVGGLEQLADGAVHVTRVRVADRYRNPYEMADPYEKDERTFTNASVEVRSAAFDPVQKRLTQTFEWGSVAVRYAAAPGKFDACIEVKNTSTQVIEQIELDLLALVAPEGAKLWKGNDNLGAPVLSSIDSLVVAGTPQANRPLSLLWEQRRPGAATLKVTVGQERGPEPYDGVWNVRPIKPGAAEEIEVALRFGPAGLSAQAVAPDLCEAFAKANPFRLRWPDRRPIAMAQLSAETDWGKGNPRGWWGLRDNGANIDTPKGREIFDTWIMGYADQLIAVAGKAGSQGVIVWDLEGKQYPGCVYYGDPRIMKHTAPEMEAMADAFFKKLRDAGLRVGMCIRPTQIYPVAVPQAEIEKYRSSGLGELPYTESWDKFNLASFALEFWAYGEVKLRERTPLTSIHRSPVERLDAKIRYCKERWGATLFYIDTNHFNRSREKRGPNAAGGYDMTQNWGAALIKATDWEELCRRHPDVLLIPEHEYTRYWASTAPYRQPPYDGATPAEVSALYPEAFSAIAMNGDAEAHIRKAVGAYSEAIRHGDILMHHGWYGPSDVVTNVYTAASATAPLRVILKADGSFACGDKLFADLPALKQAVAAQVKGKPFADRRVFVQYAPGTAAGKRAAGIAALEQADAIIAWEQPLQAVP
jgi:hypothetical protein